MLYTPHGAARKLWACRDREAVIEGPAGTGKTVALLWKIHLAACKYKGMRGCILRKTRAALTQSVLELFEDEVLSVENGSCTEKLRNILTAGAGRKLRESYKYPNGSELVICGLDETTRTYSTRYDMVAAFEAVELSLGDWEDMLRPLRNWKMPYQQIIGDTNPSVPWHWLNMRAHEGTVTRLCSRHKDNPMLWDMKKRKWTKKGLDYIKNVLGAMTGSRRQRLLLGVWAAAEGLVYEEYDAAVHLIDRFKIPSEWPRYRVVDFGYTNPFVCQWWASDGDSRLFMYRELYRSQDLVEHHAAVIRKHSEGERFVATICDHDAEGMAQLRKAGIPTKPAIKNPETGRECVKARLLPAGDGKPRIFWLRDSLIERDEKLVSAGKPWCTEQEWDGYCWPKGGDGRPVKEQPVKVNDHGMDCNYMLTLFIDGKPAFEVPRVPKKTGRLYSRAEHETVRGSGVLL